jgi:hypothetical protein
VYFIQEKNYIMLLTTDYASRNIGDVFFTLRNDATLNGAVPCDGSEYSASDFSTISEDVNPYSLCVAGRLPNVDYATYNLQVKNNGSCASFGIDTINGKFKVPTIKNVFIEAGDTSTLAKYMAPGLPNITGSVKFTATNSTLSTVISSSGSLSHTKEYAYDGAIGQIANASVGPYASDLNLDASKSSSIYGASSTVQPKSLLLRPMVQLVTVSGNTVVEGSDGSDSDTVIPTYTIPYVFVPGTEAKATEVNANFDYVLSILRGFSIDAASAKVVHLDGDEIITGQKTFVTNPIISSIEIKPESGSPYIDFHYNGESSDYSARIIEGTRGYLQLNQNPPTDDSSTKIATTNWVAAKVSASSTSKTTILATLAPNRSGAYSISSGWTAPKYGWVSWYSGANDRSTRYLYINGVEVGYHSSYKYTDPHRVEYMVSPNDKVTFTAGTTAKFFPCKGA